MFGPTAIAVTMDDFSPAGRCDLTGLIFLHKDLEPVLQWSGNTLVDTGLLAEKSHNDEPNPFFKTPRTFKDPRPQLNARPYPEAYTPPDIPYPGPPKN